MADETTTLWRPVGVKELELIRASGMRAFPPRLPHQPIFYPVLDFEYADYIARVWNVKDEPSGFAGFVTEFDVLRSFLDGHEVRTAGSATRHREYWIPADGLDAFNAAIVGLIRVVAEYHGRAPGTDPALQDDRREEA